MMMNHPPTCPSLCDAIARNNLAVKQIESGDFHSANINLSQATKLLHRILKHSPTQLPSRQRGILTDRVLVDLDASPQETGYVYRYSHLIASENESSGNYSEASIAILGVIVFNLALVYHAIAIQGKGVAKDQMLMKALRLYRNAYQLQMRDFRVLDSMLVLAILNNMAHIHQLTNDDHNAGVYWRLLLSRVVDQRDSSGPGGYSDEVGGFLSNVMCFMFKASISAPAA